MAELNSRLRLTLVDEVSGRMRAVSGALTVFQRQTRAIMSPFMGMTARFAALGAGYLGATAGIDGTINAARDMQSALTEVGVKADLTDNQISRLRRQILALSPATNQATADLIAGVDTMVGLGLSAEDAAAAIPAIGKAATATGATMADLSAATVSALQNLRVQARDLPKMLDVMAAAGNAGAFELRDMAQYIPSLGAAYQGLGQHGVSAVTDLAAALQIVRKGTGDSASAATNLGNVLQKVNAPQTRAAFKKMGVNLEKEMTKASKRGLTPIEAIAEITQKTLKGDLKKLGDLFSDAQVQQGLRPLIQNLEEYRRIRDDVARADGTVADAYGRRMRDAAQQMKAFRIAVENLGTSIGSRALGPLGEAAQGLADILNTLDQRVTVFDRVRAGMEGFAKGLGFDGGLTEGLTELRDFIFGHADASAAADQYGRIFKNFHEWGQSVGSFTKAIADNPIGKFLGEMSGYGFRLMVAAAGISIMAGAVRKLAAAVALLTGISTAASIIKTLAGVGGLLGKATPKTPTAPALPVLPFIAKALPWLTLPFLSGDTPKDRRDGDDPRMDAWTSQWWRMQGWERGGPNTRGRRDRGQVERDQSLDGWLDGPATRALLPQVQGGLTIEDLRSAVVKTEPTGVARVEVTNGMRPNVIINQSNTFNNVPDPERVAGQIGGAVKASVEASYSDGGL